MKVRKRILSVLLAASMLFSASAPAWAAGEEGGGQTAQSAVTGEIRATLRLDYAQNMKAIKNHNVQAFLKPGPNNMPHFDEDTAVTSEPGFNLWEIGKVQTVGSYSATVIAKNRDGGIMEFGEDNWSQYEDRWPGYLELAIDGLPQGEYTITFYGIGYATFSQNIEIKEYSQHLIIGTGDNTFTLGDLTRDGRVDQEDLDIIETKEYLSTPPSEADLKQVGFNGDGVIDVIDLAYVKRSSIIQPAGENVASDAVLNNTVLLVPPVNTAALAEELKKQGVSVENGDLNDLFVENGQGVTLTSAEEKIQLPLEFSTPKDVEQIVVNAPNNNIGAKNVSAEVTYEENGGEKIETFEMEGAPLPADVHAIGRAGEDSKSIVINLGKRVPVKKITISVEKTTSGHVAVESIQFLKDIVPKNPVAPNQMVKNLKAEAGSEKVDLRWSELPNVTGYRVSYWEDGADANKKELSVDVPYAEVSGLENLKTYCFQVIPTADDENNGVWEGKYCDPVKAMPEPDKEPDAPDMVSVQELEGKLAVSWKKSKAATYYQVFYKEKEAPDSAYQQAGGDLTATSVTIESLKNETTYSIYIIAGNDIGKSGPSRIAEGTPKAVRYDGLEGLPTEALLDSDTIKSVRLADPNNYAPGEYTAEAPFKANFLIDNNLRTHWTARNWAGNEHVICEFTEPVDL